jgi:aquaporin Z
MWALSQLWVFWLAPLVGAVAAGATWRRLFESRATTDVDERWRAAA